MEYRAKRNGELGEQFLSSPCTHLGASCSQAACPPKNHHIIRLVYGQFVPWSDRSKSDRSTGKSDRPKKKSDRSTI